MRDTAVLVANRTPLRSRRPAPVMLDAATERGDAQLPVGCKQLDAPVGRDRLREEDEVSYLSIR